MAQMHKYQENWWMSVIPAIFVSCKGLMQTTMQVMFFADDGLLRSLVSWRIGGV